MSTDHDAQFEAGISGLPVPGPHGDATGRDPLEVLASEFLENVRHGREPILDELVAAHRELADEIRELFPLLGALEDWKGYAQRTSLDHRSLETLPSKLFGDFRILREIGRGGMGIVFEAEQASNSHRVAVKVLPYVRTRERRARFHREATTAAQLRHAHIVPVHSYGEYDGLCYYVMRLVKGVGLDWLIHRLRDRQGIVYADEVAQHFADSASRDASAPESSTPFSNGPPGAARLAGPAAPRAESRSLSRNGWQQIARIGVQIADALHHAHSHGTLHRDIKPGNLLLDADGCVWVTDFGLAQNTEEFVESGGTRLAGTLRYMAPEQFEGRFDARCDIYSLGVTLYELMTLVPAFQAADQRSLVDKIVNSPLPAPRRLNANIPRSLEAIVMKATARDARRRYASAAELWADLLRFLKGERVHAPSASRWPKFRRP
jgi:serine/threonine protein kinase